jgi:hypothetical protein
MSYREIEEARETLKRTSAETRSASREPLIPEDSVAKWKREMGELEKARELEKERMGMVQQLYQSTMKCQRDIAAGLAAVNKFATAISDRIEGMSDEISELRTKLTVAEARIDDLVKARAAPVAEVVELPNPISKRRA